MSSSITHFTVDHGCCNEKELTVLDLSAMKELTVFETATNCFENVRQFKVIGLDKLERVVIGSYCFTPTPTEEEPCYFYVKDCIALKELKIGASSFIYYPVCEIANVSMLEVIEIGESRVYSSNFIDADLVLKGCEG